MEPAGGAPLQGTVEIQWTGEDADGDQLDYGIFFSSDDGLTWEPIINHLQGPSYVWDIGDLPPGINYRIKVIATDGVNMGEDISDNAFAILGQTYLPVIKR